MSINTDGLENSPVDPLITLKPETRMFETPGGTYYVNDDISVGRYQHYGRLEIQLGFNLRYSTIVDNLLTAYNALNERRDADAAVAVKNILEGVTLAQDRKPIALYVATLIINKSGEDLSEWSEALANEKINDWKGINSSFFFGLALALVRGFPERYNKIANLMQSVGQVSQKMEGLTED